MAFARFRCCASFILLLVSRSCGSEDFLATRRRADLEQEMTLQRRYIVIGAVVVLTVVLTAVLMMKRLLGAANADGAGPPAQRLAPVVLAARAPLENVITLTGEFRPFQQVDVHAKVSGYIRHIFVDVGDKVRAG